MTKTERIEQIKNKTKELIALNGSLDSVRTKDISNAIDASEATIFKYFNSKEHIFESILIDYIESRPLKINHSKVDTLPKFKSALNKILDFTFDTSPYRNNNVSLIICASLKKHSITYWNYNNLKDEVWSFIEDRITYGKKHWNFDRSLDPKTQARLFYYAPLMFYIQMELFDGKSVESFDYQNVKKVHMKNFMNILQNS